MQNNINKFYKFILLMFLFITLSVNVFGQATINPFYLKSSELYKKLDTYKVSEPNATTLEVVTKANELLSTEGLNFVFAFDTETCQKINEFKSNEKNKDKPLTLRATLQSTDGERTAVVLPQAKFDISECGTCFVELPLLEITKDNFVSKLNGINIKFNLPSNFSLNTVNLFNIDDLSKPINFWIIPSKLVPTTISPDSSILYFDLLDKKYEDITLAFFNTGVFQFFAKKDLDLDLKGKKLKVNNSSLSYLSFGEKTNKKILGFNNPCE